MNYETFIIIFDTMCIIVPIFWVIRLLFSNANNTTNNEKDYNHYMSDCKGYIVLFLLCFWTFGLSFSLPEGGPYDIIPWGERTGRRLLVMAVFGGLSYRTFVLACTSWEKGLKKRKAMREKSK